MFLQNAFFVNLSKTFLLLALFTIKNAVFMIKFISKCQINVNKIFDSNDEYFQIGVVIEALNQAVITLEQSKKAIQYLTFEMY